MSGKIFTDLIVTAGAIGIITALTKPGRQTAAVTTAGASGIANIFKSVIG